MHRVPGHMAALMMQVSADTTVGLGTAKVTFDLTSTCTKHPTLPPLLTVAHHSERASGAATVMFTSAPSRQLSVTTILCGIAPHSAAFRRNTALQTNVKTNPSAPSCCAM